MQECLKRCGFTKTTPCLKGWGEPLVTPHSQHSHSPGLPEHVGMWRECRQATTEMLHLGLLVLQTG